MKLLSAADATQLRTALGSLDIAVPLRSEGRTTRHVERYACVRLLATLPFAEWQFPLAIDHADRPDFHIIDGDRDIGLEHVEAVPQNQAHADVMREQGVGPDTYFLRAAQPGERRKTGAQLRREILEDAQGGPWIGDSPERQWAQAMGYFIERKVEAARRPGFTRRAESWLLVYDNWPLPVIAPELAAQKLVARPELAAGLSCFDRIFVLDEQQLWGFGRDGVVSIRPVIRTSGTGHRNGRDWDNEHARSNRATR